MEYLSYLFRAKVLLPEDCTITTVDGLGVQPKSTHCGHVRMSVESAGFRFNMDYETYASSSDKILMRCSSGEPDVYGSAIVDVFRSTKP